MLPAAVQLHQHGGGGRVVVQQAGRLQFGVGEIQAAARRLRLRVGLQIRRAGQQAQAVEAQGTLFGKAFNGAQHLFAQVLVQFEVAGGAIGAQAPFLFAAGAGCPDGVRLREEYRSQARQPLAFLPLPLSGEGGGEGNGLDSPKRPFQFQSPLRIGFQAAGAVFRQQRAIFPAFRDEPRRGIQAAEHVFVLAHPQHTLQLGARHHHRILAAQARRPPLRAPRQQAVQQLAQAGQRQFRRQRGKGRFQRPAAFPPEPLDEGMPGLLAQQGGILDDLAGRAQGQGGARQQVEEPAVEGGDHRPGSRGQHLFQQPPRRRQRGPRLRLTEAALDQEIHRRLGRQQGQILQPGIQPLAHLRRRLAREGDGQQLRRLRPRQQQAQHARHQQPGLAAAGTGLHHGAAGGVEGG